MPQGSSIYTDQLENELKTPVTGAKRAYKLIETLAFHAVGQAKELQSISRELYGNGVPGGLKAKMSELDSKVDATRNTVDQILTGLVSGKFPVNNVFIDEHEPAPEKKDSFQKVVDWFVDKVLPALTIALIFGILDVFLFMFLVRAGYVSVSGAP